jgi:hypothetical protein
MTVTVVLQSIRAHQRLQEGSFNWTLASWLLDHQSWERRLLTYRLHVLELPQIKHKQRYSFLLQTICIITLVRLLIVHYHISNQIHWERRLWTPVTFSALLLEPAPSILECLLESEHTQIQVNNTKASIQKPNNK